MSAYLMAAAGKKVFKKCFKKPPTLLIVLISISFTGTYSEKGRN